MARIRIRIRQPPAPPCSALMLIVVALLLRHAERPPQIARARASRREISASDGVRVAWLWCAVYHGRKSVISRTSEAPAAIRSPGRSLLRLKVSCGAAAAGLGGGAAGQGACVG